MTKSIVHVTRPTSKLPKGTIHDLWLWLPELTISSLFLLGAMLTGGAVSLACLLVAAAPAAWIVACRAQTARTNRRVLAEYDAELAAADARMLAQDDDEDGHR